LTEDFTGEEKVETLFGHDFARQSKHHGVAVNARIHVFAVAVSRGFEHIQVNLADIFDNQRNAYLLRRLFRFAATEEWCDEGNRSDLDALTLKTQGR
jgi:hypothetical protein